MAKKKVAKKTEEKKIEKIESFKGIKSEHLKPIHEIEWETPEFKYYPKNKYWIFGISVLLLAFIAVFVWFGQYLLAVAAVLAGVVFYQYGHAKPEKVKVKLTDKGVTFNKDFYDYETLRSFWVISSPHEVLYLQPVKLFHFPVTILVEGESIDKVENYLHRYLPFHPTGGEHINDWLSRMLRF